MELSCALYIAIGVITTLKYSVISVAIGFILGTILAMMKISGYSFPRYAANIYTSIFRGTPLLIQLSIIYYAIPGILDLKVSIFVAGVLAFSFNSAAYTSEIIRAGLNAVDKGQFEAAKTLGIPYFATMRGIIIPQALRCILPSLINEMVNMTKETAIISMFGEMDLMRRAQMVSSQTYSYFFPMITAAICYYFVVFTLNWCAKIVERKVSL